MSISIQGGVCLQGPEVALNPRSSLGLRLGGKFSKRPQKLRRALVSQAEDLQTGRMPGESHAPGHVRVSGRCIGFRDVRIWGVRAEPVPPSHGERRAERGEGSTTLEVPERTEGV